MISFRSFSCAAILSLIALPALAIPTVAANLPSASYSASQTWAGSAEKAFNGPGLINGQYGEYGWNSGTSGWQWIQVDLGQPFQIHEVNFVTAQQPHGTTYHNVYVSQSPIGHNWSALTPVASRSGFTTDVELLSLSFAPTSGRYVEILANGGPSWTALAAVRVQAVQAIPEPATYAMLLAGVVVVALAKVRNSFKDNGQKMGASAA
jgi:hypothetical protein